MLSKLHEIIQNLETEEYATTNWGGDVNLFFDVQLMQIHQNLCRFTKTQAKLCMQITKNYVREWLMRHIQATFSLRKTLYMKMKNSFQAKKAWIFFISDSLQDLVNAIEIIPSV